MKTKISHLGRSSVSVILAVMMLLSTMLVGTVSTVNAASTLQPTTGEVADGYYRIFVTDNYNFNSAPLIHYWGGSSATNWDTRPTMNKVIGTNAQGESVYWYDVPSGSTGVIFQHPDKKQSVDLNVKTDQNLKFGNGAGYYISSESDGKYKYAYWDASGLLPQETNPDVADSVALTANPTSVKVGNSVTLTPTVSGAKSDNLTYTYNKTSGGSATEVKNDDNSLTVTPTAAGTYKYTVTVSADGYSPVTSTEVSFTVTDPVIYYLAGRIKQNGSSDWVNSKVDTYKFTESDTEGLYYYESNYTPKQWSAQASGHNQYFFIIDSSSPSQWYGSNDNSSSNTPKVLNSTNDKSNLIEISSTDDTKTLTYISNQENISNVTFWLDTRNGNMQLYYTSATAYSVTFGSNSTSMGSVTAKNGSSNISSGDGVAENSEVTFTATANEGYRFDGWYSDADCTNPIDGASNATYTVNNISQAVSAYAKFSAVSYNITTEHVANYSVVVRESAEYNSTVSVKVTATDDAYEVNGITVTDKDNKVVNASGGESGVYTFTMPASNVTVKANSKLKQIGAPTVTFNVLGQSIADANVLGSTVITARYTAAENSTIVEGSEKVAVTDANGTTVSADKYSLVKNTATGNYTFTANEPGAYKLSYTVTAKSNYDASMTITNSPVSVTITVSYTDTQNAYLALSKYVDEVKDTTSDGYTTDSYAAFSAALTSARDLLTGLPNADATNASDYTNAKTALETAFNGLEKDVTYYIGGRFKGESWNPNRTDMQFVKVDGESNLYKYETNMTVSQLSQNVDKAKQYFFIHTGNGNEKVYYASSDGLGHTFHKNSINNQLTLKYYPTKADDEKNYIKFDDVADSSSNVVLYLDTSDKDNLKLYYSADIDPEYRLTGDLSAIGGWKGYDSALKFDTAESDGSYSKIITVTNEDVNSKYFKLIKSENGSDKYYGPNDSKYNIISSNSSLTAYETFEGSGSGKDFYFSKAGTYKIHYIVKTGKNTPSVWVEENTTKYNVTVAENIKSIASVDKTKAAKGETVTVTATSIPQGQILDTVTVVGANNTQVTTIVSGNTAKFTMPDQDVTVTGVTFRTANTYTVTFSSSNDNFGTVSAKYNSADFTSGATVTEGGTVTFTAEPKSGYALSGWTVNGKSETLTDSSLSLKITADTTVVANFQEVTVTPSGYYLLCGENAKFEAGSYTSVPLYTNEEGVYYADFNAADITKNKDYFIIFSTKEDTSGIIVDNNNVTVNAVNKNGFSLSDYNENVQKPNGGSNNVKFAKVYINGDSDVTGFTIKITNLDVNSKKITYSAEPTFDVAPADTVEITAKDGTVRGGYYGKTTSALGDTTLKVTSPDGTTTITAIDSCNFDGHSQGVTAKKVPYGSTVTVKTTINPDATFAGHSGSDYYVKGFSINGFTGGVLTQQAGNTHTSDVYEYTFTVKEDVYADVSTIEITPIYFLKDDSDCITFYVENFMDAKAKWGDTIACYAYYSSEHALGDYPGQPMVNAEGSIYMQIPKHIGSDASNVVKGITLNNYVWDFVHVSGGDDARKQKNCQTYDYDDFKYLANMSKVNSSDSAADIKNIVYRFKYHTYNNTSAEAGNVPNDTLTGTTVDNTKYEVFVDYYDKPTDIFGTIINGNDAVTVDTVKDESEYLTIVSDGYVNYYKDTAKYLGQYATKWYIYNKAGQKVAALPPSALLYGLTKSSTQLENLVTQDTAPADFMSDSGASTSVISGYWASFKSLYTDYAGKYAIINYESAIHSSGRDGAEAQPGERCDGRWYYSVDNAKITGDIKIEYADTLDSFTTMKGVKTDTFTEGTATGKNTAAEAYFTSPAGQSSGGKPTHVETTSDNSENFMFTVGATSSTTSGYTFVGWYRLIDDTYKAVNDPSELNKTTGQVARNANVVLVARYIKTPGGSMTFHHSLYNGENAGGGKATTKIQVVVKSSDDSKEYYKSGIIDSTASIDQKTISKIVADQQDAKITVTLYTTTMNLYNFNGYYSAENTTDITAFKPTSTPVVSGDRKEGLVTTSEYTFSFNEYYNNHKDTLIGDNAGTVYYNFYSDITSIKVPYKVQFSYTDRTGEQKYYNKAGYVDPENTSSYTFVEKNTGTNGEGSNAVEVTLTNSFILSLAPYESNFTKNLTWDETSISNSNTAFDSSNSKSIASAVVNSDQSDRTIHLNVFRDNNGDPTPRTNANGHFELFTKNDSAELPYGSVFYEQNTDGTYTYDITAPETYEGKQFMYWEIYSDQECENLVIKAYNSEGNFSYVAYDNCWIVPVYGESSTPVASVKEVSTSTQFMEVTRNQWTAGNADSFTGFDADNMTTLDTAVDFIKGNGEDKLYADFVLNFFYNGKQLNVFDPNSSKVQTGIVMQKLELEKDSIGVGYNTDMEYYANKYIDDLPTAAEDAKSKILTGKSSIESLTKQINNDRLDNKNRLQYYARFNNTEANANCVYRVYTYIKYVNESNDTVVELGKPIYFTLYDVANATV